MFNSSPGAMLVLGHTHQCGKRALTAAGFFISVVHAAELPKSRTVLSGNLPEAQARVCRVAILATPGFHDRHDVEASL